MYFHNFWNPSFVIFITRGGVWDGIVVFVDGRNVVSIMVCE